MIFKKSAKVIRIGKAAIVSDICNAYNTLAKQLLCFLQT